MSCETPITDGKQLRTSFDELERACLATQHYRKLGLIRLLPIALSKLPRSLAALGRPILVSESEQQVLDRIYAQIQYITCNDQKGHFQPHYDLINSFTLRLQQLPRW